MEDRVIIWIAFFLIDFNISGLATTNILRLTHGNTFTVLNSKCRCDNCGAAITPVLQLPIVSYIICRGRCTKCKAKISVFVLILEVFILLGMFLLQSVFSFSVFGVTLSFIYYELVRVLIILKKGKRLCAFAKQYLIAILVMFPYYLMSVFVSLLYEIVAQK